MLQFLGIGILFYFLSETFPEARNIFLTIVLLSVCWMFASTPAGGLSLFFILVCLIICFFIIRYIHVIVLFLLGIALGIAFLYMLIAGLGQMLTG